MTTTGTREVESPSHEQVVATIPAGRRWADLGLVLLVAIAPLVVGAVYALFVPVTGSRESTNFRFLTGLFHEAGGLALMTCLLQRQGRQLKSIGLRFGWRDLPVAIGLLVAQWLALAFVYQVLSRAYFFWTGTYLQWRNPQTIFVHPALALGVAYVIASPVFEESIVRAYLMTELIDLSCPVWLAVCISTCVQTTYHLYYGVVGAIYVGAGFLVASVYFAKSRRLMPLIIAHLLWDVTTSISYWYR
jgi:membrane protease YdiL (CAAX protease family)